MNDFRVVMNKLMAVKNFKDFTVIDKDDEE